MRRLTILTAIMLFPVCLPAQDLQLTDCLKESLKNNPIAANKELAIQIGDEKKAILKSAWLPSLDLNGQATWQSDVLVLNLDLPFPVNFPKIPKDQYKITADVTQMIYDGGSIKNQKVLEDINAQLSVQEIGIKEFELQQTVEEIYFSILVVDKRIEVLKLIEESLQETIHQVESGVKNGILSESEVPVIAAEKNKLDQQLISLRGLKIKAVKTLSLLMGKQISVDTHFLIPIQVNEASLQGNRPEYQLFEIQNNLLDARKTQLNSLLKPRFMAFGQAGYGKPGLNFMGDKWDPYLLAGVKGSWTIWDWKKVRRQQKTLSLNQSIVANQREAFSRQVNQAEESQLQSISDIQSLLLLDHDLLANREKVTAAYKSRLSNGLVTASQFMNEWTREQEARINLEVRKIELVSSEYKLLSIQGKF